MGGGEAFLSLLLDGGGNSDELALGMGGEDGLELGGDGCSVVCAGVGEGRELSPRAPVSEAESVSEAEAENLEFFFLSRRT